MKTVSVAFFDAKSLIRKELTPIGQSVTVEVYKGVFIDELLTRITGFRPDFHATKDRFLLHDNAPCRNAISIHRVLTGENVTILHLCCPYSPHLVDY